MNMPLKTDAIVTVDADQLVTVNIGQATVNPNGTVTVRVSEEAANMLVRYSAATITTPADNT